MIIVDFILCIIIYKILWNLYYRIMTFFSDRYHSERDIEDKEFEKALRQGIIISSHLRTELITKIHKDISKRKINTSL